MDFFQAIILSIVEGLTEFLPVSSTGHLVLTSDILNIPQTEFVKSFEVIIQLGAILAVVVLYASQILLNKTLWIKILISFIPTAILGLIFYNIIKAYLLGNTSVTLIALFLGGIVFIVFELFYNMRSRQEASSASKSKRFIIFDLIYKEKQFHTNEAPRPYGRGIFSLLLRREQNPSEAENSSHSSPPLAGYSAKGDKMQDIALKQAFLIGLFQSVSMVPGVSRAAATILGGMFLGLSRKTAVEYSFLLAIPTMFAATGLDLYKSNFNFSFEEYQLLGIGLLGSFITALFAIKFFLSYIQNHTFIPFGVYRIILALVFWLLLVGF